MAELLKFRVTRVYHSGLAPESIKLGAFYGLVVYIRSYAANTLNAAMVHTGRNLKEHILGRSDMVSGDIVIENGELIFRNSGSPEYWGGLNILLIGSDQI